MNGFAQIAQALGANVPIQEFSKTLGLTEEEVNRANVARIFGSGVVH